MALPRKMHMHTFCTYGPQMRTYAGGIKGVHEN